MEMIRSPYTVDQNVSKRRLILGSGSRPQAVPSFHDLSIPELLACWASLQTLIRFYPKIDKFWSNCALPKQNIQIPKLLLAAFQTKSMTGRFHYEGVNIHNCMK
jgi:hypothetical protein